MKSYDVDMDSFVNVSLPDDCDPTTPAGYAVLWEQARQKFIERLRDRDVSFQFEPYPADEWEDE